MTSRTVFATAEDASSSCGASNKLALEKINSHDHHLLINDDVEILTM